MRVGIATDHGGFGLKEDLRERVAAAGHDVVEFGAFKLDPGDDYQDFVVPLARAVAAGKVERGVAVCGSGVGATLSSSVSISMEKVAGGVAPAIKPGGPLWPPAFSGNSAPVVHSQLLERCNLPWQAQNEHP